MRDVFSAWLVMTIFACGTTAPVESVTVPKMVPNVDCARRAAGSMTTAAANFHLICMCPLLVSELISRPAACGPDRTLLPLFCGDPASLRAPRHPATASLPPRFGLPVLLLW